MLYTINGSVSASTTLSTLTIPLNASSKLLQIEITCNDVVNLLLGFSDENNILDLNEPSTGNFVINDKPNSYVIYFRNDDDARASHRYDIENFNIIVENDLLFTFLANAGRTVYFTLTLEYTEQPIDAKNTLIRDLAEAVTQVADGENLISAGEVFFQKRIRGLKQVGQGDFAV